MIAVLSVRNPAAAKDQLIREMAFVDLGLWRELPLLGFGEQKILVVARGIVPDGMIEVPLDHLALRVPDVTAFFGSAMSKGARLDPAFTPDGPRVIPEFWDQGLCCVFFQGPDGAPLEFCQRIGSANSGIGHDHFGVRCESIQSDIERLVELGGEEVASHNLESGSGKVRVFFMHYGNRMFELFDEEHGVGAEAFHPWIGLVPDGSATAGSRR